MLLAVQSHLVADSVASFALGPVPTTQQGCAHHRRGVPQIDYAGVPGDVVQPIGLRLHLHHWREAYKAAVADSLRHLWEFRRTRRWSGSRTQSSLDVGDEAPEHGGFECRHPRDDYNPRKLALHTVHRHLGPLKQQIGRRRRWGIGALFQIPTTAARLEP